jgi:hypothetical protein
LRFGPDYLRRQRPELDEAAAQIRHALSE